MTYLRPRLRPRPAARRRPSLGAALGDFWSDLFGTSPPSGTPQDYNLNDPSASSDGEPTSSSSTTQDTTVLPDGSVVGGQATGTPTAPTGQWKNISGVCYATNTTFLGAIKELQRQLNRVLSAKGQALIGVDGSVGPVTRAAVLAVGSMGAYASIVNNTVSSCDQICSNIYAFTGATSRYADSLSAPASVSSPAPASPPQVWNPVSGQLTSQGIAASAGDVWGNLSSTEKIAALAVFGGAALLVSKSSKKKGRR